MLRKLSAVVLAVVLTIAASSAVQAQGRWVMLGERHIDGRMDTDKIDIGRDAGTFRAVQFRVEGGTVRFDHIRIKYLNGASEDIATHAEVPPGGRSQLIDLPGNRRVIESISMWYAKENWRTRPTVRVYGIR